jgi:L-ornithine Nalpha-acyltransferase
VAQRLRYRVFHDEFGSLPANEPGIDVDRFDDIAQHLLVVEPFSATPSDFAVEDGNLVGTYRLITQLSSERIGGFYSGQEFDLAPLLERNAHLHFLELGRSCVLKQARGAAVVELLWQGIWNFVREHKIDVMLGCASFDGTDVSRHVEALNFLAQLRPTPAQWQVSARPERFCAVPAIPMAEIDAKCAQLALPPLIKGYLRLGCYFGDGCVIDPDFNAIDVLVILPVADINPRFFARFGAPLPT